jgi:glycosyltransferase involved in cell wall biosynthesis
MQYKLSIITINRNNSHGLRKTCLSVATQTFKDFEWIIIDGASTDDSVDIIKQHSNNISYWVSEPDSGIYNAINKGIKIATGEYLLFLNSGDYLLHPWTLQEVIDEIKTSKDADVYFSDVITSNYQLHEYNQNVNLDFFIRKGMINHQNCLIRRKLFNHRLYDEKYQITADWQFFLRETLEHNITFFHIETKIAVFDIWGISNKNSEKRHFEKKCGLMELNIEQKNEKIYSLWGILKMVKYLLPYGFYNLLKKIKLDILFWKSNKKIHRNLF